MPGDAFLVTTGIIPTGLVPDGITDNTAAIQNAVNAGGVGHEVLIPSPGLYKCTGHLTIPGGVSLKGSRRGPSEPTAIFPSLVVNSAALLATDTSTDFITFTGWDSEISDLVIHYPNQVQPTSSTPVVYPWTIAATTGAVNCRVKRMHITNAYQAIYLQGSRQTVEDCNIGALLMGVKLDNSFDIDYLTNINLQEFYEVGWADPTNLGNWVLANGTGFEFGQVGIIANRLFSYRRNIGFHFNGTGAGVISGLDFDSHNIFIKADGTDPNIGYNFTNFLALAMPGSGAATSAIIANGTSRLRLSAGNFIGWPNTFSTVASGAHVDLSGVTNSSDGENYKGKASAGKPDFALDVSGSQSFTLPDNATMTPFSNTNNFSGMFLITDSTVTGQTGMFLQGAAVSGSGAILVAQTGNQYTTIPNTAGKVNIYAVSGVVTVQNKTGVSLTAQICAVRSRNACP
jgi:hypothetical protein